MYQLSSDARVKQAEEGAAWQTAKKFLHKRVLQMKEAAGVSDGYVAWQCKMQCKMAVP